MTIKRNIIVVGDSFCSSAQHWPQQLADLLDLNLICYTEGAGQSWWAARHWLQYVHPAHWDNTVAMVFAHTNAERIPTDNPLIGQIDHSAQPTTELATAIQLYHRHIFDLGYAQWAQAAWFQEISQRWGHLKLVHLHSFPWSLDQQHHLSGINITTPLVAVSLNELGATKFELFADTRPNHLNAHNNQALAQELARIIQLDQLGNHALDLTDFEQKTQKWLGWK
jgi:hypothetical protein